MARARFERGKFEDTYGVVDLAEFGLEHPDRLKYQPSAWRHLSRALEGREIRPSDVFVDFGCGKGRVVYQAARLPFRRVIGLELSPQLLEVARRNVERNRHRLFCQQVELVCGDAATWRVPDDVTYVYLYNPFVGEVFEAALRNIVESLERSPRALTMIYVFPVMAEAVQRTGRFSQVRCTDGRRHEQMTIWETTPGRGRRGEALPVVRRN